MQECWCAGFVSDWQPPAIIQVPAAAETEMWPLTICYIIRIATAYSLHGGRYISMYLSTYLLYSVAKLEYTNGDGGDFFVLLLNEYNTCLIMYLDVIASFFVSKIVQFFLMK